MCPCDWLMYLQVLVMCANDCKCDSVLIVWTFRVWALCKLWIHLSVYRHVCAAECGDAWCVVTQQWVLQGAADRQDVLVNQFDGTRSVGDLIVEVVGQSRSLQLQLLGLQGRLCRRLCGRAQQVSVHEIHSSSDLFLSNNKNKAAPGK